MQKKFKGKKKWLVATKRSDDIVDQLLLNRRIDLDKKEKFLNPDFLRDLHNPLLLKNMAEALKRIRTAKKKKETVGVFGDYDTDGATSAALLTKVLQKIGLNVVVYIPNREEGYGINNKGIDYLRAQKVTLMISVDCGVTGKSEVNYAKRLGMETVIIDHHLVQKKHLPSGIVINPKQKGDGYPFSGLSAGGLVYKFITALARRYPKLISQNDLKWYLDLVAISTVADMVPLLGENRTLVKYGLIVLKKTKNIGLQQLIKVAGIEPLTIDPAKISFQIAPRLNAPGRIDNATTSYQLLMEDDIEKAKLLAQELNAINITRQDTLETMLSQARNLVLKQKLHQNKIIVVAQEGWQTGLVGLVAGKLMEEFARPAIVLTRQGKIAKGSARSLDAFHLLEAFDNVSEYLTSYGGHAKAGGLALETKHIDVLYEKLLSYADGKLKDDDLIPTIKVDMELPAANINLALVKLLEQFEPYGYDNPKPLFILRSQNVQNLSYVGAGKQHIKAKINNIPAIFFDGINNNFQPKAGDTIDYVASFSKNIWNGQTTVQALIHDWRLAE